MRKHVFRLLLTAACVWLVLGVIAAATLAGWESDFAAYVIIVPGIAVYLVSTGFGRTNTTSGLLWDSAHSPPFLNAAGVLVVYFCPAVFALVQLLRHRVRAAPGSIS